MTSNAGIQQQQLQAASLPVLPAVLVYQLPQLKSPQLDAEILLLQNPTLLLQVIEQRELFRNPGSVKQCSELFRNLDRDWLAGLLHNLALRQCLQPQEPDSNIRAQLWRQLRLQALLAGALARQMGYLHPAGAATAATLAGIGLLVQESAHGNAWAQLFTQTATLAELLQAEQTLYGTQHVEVGVQVLEQLQLGSALLDCVRYQAAGMLEVRDASTLVRIVWLARFLSEQHTTVDEGALGNAQRILGLSPVVMQSIHKRAVEQLNEELRYTNLQQLLASPNVQAGQASVITVLLDNQQRQLKQLVLHHSAYTALEQESAESVEQLHDLLVRLLRQAGVTGGFLLLVEDPESANCSIVLQHGCELGEDDFSIRCEPGRSALATAVLSQSLTTLAADSRHLTVVDRQFMQALGNVGIICEPVRTDNCHAALLLTANGGYAAQSALRQLIKHKLENFLKSRLPALAELPESTLRYRQQVRETVHEINNPLSIIRNYLQLFAKGVDTPIAPDIFKQLDGEIERMSGLLASLREIAPARPAASSCELNALVMNLGSVLGAALGGSAPESISLTVHCAPDPLLVAVNPDLLKQIITNLVKNATEALTAPGAITLTTNSNVYFMDQLYTQLIVADDGPGIATDRMQRLFSQRESSKGARHSGAGLAIVKGLMDEIQGKISCQSDSKGTAFYLLLPQAK